MKYPVVPALIPDTREAVLQFANQVTFTNEIQIDVVDGEFVSMKSWPYEPEGDAKTIKHATDRYTLEVDLMVKNPVAAAESWLAAGADMLVFHVESLPYEVFEKFVGNCSASVGVSSHGETDLETLFTYAELADYVQLMGIRTIGQQGEPFDERVLEQIKAVKNRFPDKLVSVDGSVNEETILRLKEAGAERFVSGSAILGAPNPEAAFRKLSSLVN